MDKVPVTSIDDPVRVIAPGNDVVPGTSGDRLAEALAHDAAPALRRITRLAERMLDVPVAMVSLNDDHGVPGVGPALHPQLADRRRGSTAGRLLDLTAAADDTLLVLDAQTDLSPRPTGAPLDGVQVASYAGQPLVASTGEVLGALCVVASEPRVWTAEDQQVLTDLAALAASEVELATRASRVAEVTTRLTALADPLARTEDAVTSLSNIADRSGDPRVERLASLARERLADLRSSTTGVQRDLGDLAGAALAPVGDAVNLGVRLLRAHKLVTGASPDADLEVEVLHRPLTIATDGAAFERRLTRLLAAGAGLAADATVRVEADRDGDDAVVRLRWSTPVPVTELVRAASLAQALRHGDAQADASLVSRGGRTIAQLEDAAASTGPDGTVVEARVPLRSAPSSGAAGPVPTPGAFPWSP